MANKYQPLTCPICGRETGVRDTRAGANYIRRRRHCLSPKCDGRLTTVEVVHEGFPLDESIVLMPRGELERLRAMINQALGEAVSPST